MRLKFFFLALISTLSLKAQKSYFEIVYNNFDSVHKPDFKSSIFLRQTDEVSISYMLPYEFSKIGLGDLKVNSKNEKVINYVFYGDTIKRYVFKNFMSNKLVFESPIDPIFREFKNFEDSLHPFMWELTDSVKFISGFICKNAKMRFRGRSYSAWYCLDIPIQNGPWKFGGLPGLIVEIYDSENFVFWKLERINREIVSIPSWPQKIDGNFNDYRTSFKSNFLKFKKALESSDGISNANCKSCGGTTEILMRTPENLTY
ncbi:MAG: GLPGLI family protein [Chitinophagaceae bacterium]|nr:GLPGLI family protein [Chitinophagaceae bacterium]